MTKPHVLVADWLMPDFDYERGQFERAGVTWSLPEVGHPPPPRDRQHARLLERIARAPRIDAVLFQLAPLDAGVIEALPDTCRLLQRTGIGLDTVDLDKAAQRGIAVRNTPDYCLEEVSVHAMAVLLSLHRQLGATHRRLLAGQWVDRSPEPIQRLSTLVLGVVGWGRIGRRLAEQTRRLVARVVYHDPQVTDPPEWAQCVTLEQLLVQSDLVSLHCPLTPDTRHLINARTLKLMKPAAVLVNTARGGLVDPEALAAALNEGRLAGAGLDVYEPEVLPQDSPLRACKNMILTSHTAWYSEQSIPDARAAAVRNILEALGGTGAD